MQFTVILRPQPDGSFQAIVPTVPGVVASGISREAALTAVEYALKDTLAEAEIASIDVPLVGETVRNPWLETAGIFADDPTWDEFVAEMRAARVRENARTFDDE